MAFVIKRFGSKMMSQAGSSFGGMVEAKRDNDAFLKTDGEWTEDIGEAHKFGMRVAAENKLATLPHAPGRGTRYEITED